MEKAAGPFERRGHNETYRPNGAASAKEPLAPRGAHGSLLFATTSAVVYFPSRSKSPGMARSTRSHAAREACFASAHVKRDVPLIASHSFARRRSESSYIPPYRFQPS